MNNIFTLGIGIPSYGRPEDLDFLLNSIANSSELPSEIVILEDCSSSAYRVNEVVDKWTPKFKLLNVPIIFKINSINLGYDKNLKEILKTSSSDFVTFIGNDDIFLSTGIRSLKTFINNNLQIKAFSRTFKRFYQENNILRFLGTSKFSDVNCIFSPENSFPAIFFRISAYFGGLTFNRKWALDHETDEFDGTLYYQVYLAGMAFYSGGIGYIGDPVVGGRTDGVPLFGAAESERGNHSPGGYSPSARATMWKEVLRIGEHIDQKYGVASQKSIRHEITVRMSFHVFEGYSHKSIKELITLAQALKKINVFNHPVPIGLFAVVLFFRGNSSYFFRFVRYIYQR